MIGISRIGKSTETENRLVIARGSERRESGVPANRDGVFAVGGGVGNVLELDSGDQCTIL